MATVKIVLILCALLIAAIACRPPATPTGTPEPTPDRMTSSSGQAWQLVWADEFDRPGFPDDTKWSYEVGYVRNDELQYYTEARQENARVEDGMLVIEARKDGYEGHSYTSASLTTQGKASWTYGRIEVRAKLPTGRGMWPAIWTLGVNIPEVGWPDCGEIDIMENVGYDPHQIHANIHNRAYNHVDQTNKGSSIMILQPYSDFHVYAVEWFEDRIEFYVDDTPYLFFPNEGTGWETWPYDREQYLIINAAIGGSWGGIEGVDDSIFPQQYSIDHVRVYQAVP